MQIESSGWPRFKTSAGVSHCWTGHTNTFAMGDRNQFVSGSLVSFRIVHPPLRSNGKWRVFAEPFPQTILSCPWRTRKLQQLQKTPGTDVARKKHRIRLESDKSWPVSAILKFHSVPFRLPSSFQMHSTLPDYSLYPNLSVRVVCQYLAGWPNIQLSVQKILAI